MLEHKAVVLENEQSVLLKLKLFSALMRTRSMLHWASEGGRSPTQTIRLDVWRIIRTARICLMLTIALYKRSCVCKQW